MTSSRQPPRISTSPVALTSLGAVGGARGTAAGALRILVEFLTTYDASQAAQLEKDLKQLDKNAAISHSADVRRAQRLGRVRSDIAEIERVTRAKLDTQQRSELTRIERLESSRLRANRAQAAIDRQNFNRTLVASKTLLPNEVSLIERRGKLTKEQDRLEKQSAAAAERRTQAERRRLGVATQLAKVETGRASLLPRLSGLAVGAIGGIVGGAILGVGFELAQAALEKIGDAIQDVIDPARHAREAIDGLGASVIEIAKAQDLTVLEAAKVKAEQLGVAAENGAVQLLAEAAAQKLASDAAKEYSKFVEAAAHSDALRDETIKVLTEALKAKAAAEKTAADNEARAAEQRARNQQQIDMYNRSIFSLSPSVLKLEENEKALAEATNLYNEIVKNNTAQIDENAKAKQRNADATALLKIQQELLNDALQNAADVQTRAIDEKIEGLDSGPSARTTQLQNLIKAASGGSNLSAALKNIADERAIILLRQRLRLLGANINLEQYSGKFLLEAINAKINALQKEAAAQARLNQLLDLQYEMSQQIKRQAGESINDFIERRAQEQRHQLAEQQNLEREKQISLLEERRDVIQDEVALAELNARRVEAIRDEAHRRELERLQEQLRASQQADRDALTAKKRALEEEKQAIVDKVRDAIKLANVQATEETLAAIRGADNLEQLNTLAGRIAGLQRAKGTIEALVAAFGIPAAIAAPFLANINNALRSYATASRTFTSDRQPQVRSSSGAVGFQHGGVLELSNARNPFGQNVRTGEGGTEIGVILSNKVAAILKQRNGMEGQIGPFYVNGSDNPMRDRYALGRLVKEAVAEALRG